MYIDIDQRIREVVPMGFDVHEKWYGAYVNPEVDLCYETLGKHVLMLSGCNIKDLLQKISMDNNLWGSSIGSLGGGNHFIELGRSEKTGKYYLTIHSGSRNFGKRVCDYHAKNQTGYRTMLSEKVSLIKEIMPKQQWNSAIKEARKQLQGREGYLTGLAKEEYMNDMYTAQAYASVNRYAMLHLILQRMGWKSGKVIETVHNYISPKDGIIRKGAVSAHLGEELIIPMNMADGILLCRGKGNEDWNCSAPHGAGRLFSRTAAKEQLSMDEFRERMSDVYSTSVCESTLDESPMAYKPTEEIRSLIEPTVEVLDVIKPVINLKAK